jgi:hypothetical protein
VALAYLSVSGILLACWKFAVVAPKPAESEAHHEAEVSTASPDLDDGVSPA